MTELFKQLEVKAELLEGDSLRVLLNLDSDLVDYCLTSPPYFQMMTYGLEGEIGLEPTISEYLDVISKVFREVYRVLREGGILSIVIGDSVNNYSTIRGKGYKRKSKFWLGRRTPQEGLKEKESLCIPNRLCTRLRSDGWQVLPELIWDKGQGARRTMTGCVSHEYVLMFIKQGSQGRRLKPLYCLPLKSSILSFPAESDLVHPCPFPLGLATTLIQHFCPEKGTVLDPFVGSGTTSVAAFQLGYSSIGIDLDIRRAKEKLGQVGSIN